MRANSSGLAGKTAFAGVIISVQPRIRLTRSFDERTHSYLGYVLRLLGTVGEDKREFSVAVGEAAHAKHGFKVGNVVSGEGVPVANERTETAELYKVSRLKVERRSVPEEGSPPPWIGVPPPLPTYRERAHRRLAVQTYQGQCEACIWGARMAVELIVDHWNPGNKRYRTETFCYGPLSCPRYKAGPTRKVPGRKGMSWEEEDWVDQEAVAHRGPDD